MRATGTRVETMPVHQTFTSASDSWRQTRILSVDSPLRELDLLSAASRAEPELLASLMLANYSSTVSSDLMVEEATRACFGSLLFL